MNCVCIVCYLFFYKDYCADTRVSYIFLLHKRLSLLIETEKQGSHT